jgi:hypothetical protein
MKLNNFITTTLLVIISAKLGESLDIPEAKGDNTAPSIKPEPRVQPPYLIESEDSKLELIEPSTLPYDRYGHSIVANTNVLVVGTKSDVLKADLYVYTVESPSKSDDTTDDYYYANDDQNQYDTQTDRRKLQNLGLPHFHIKSTKITSPENYGDGYGLSTSLSYDGNKLYIYFIFFYYFNYKILIHFVKYLFIY